MKKVMLICPPDTGNLEIKRRYCFSPVDAMPFSMRVCNSIARIGAALKSDYEVFVRDYKSEKLSHLSLLDDVLSFDPDVVYMETSAVTLFSDLRTLRTVKSSTKNAPVILKGDVFFDSDEDFLKNINLSCVDYLVGADEHNVVPRIINSLFSGSENIENIPFILYKKDGFFVKNDFSAQVSNFDEAPFPDRNFLKNRLYVMPESQHLAAVIDTVSGTSGKTIFDNGPQNYSVRSAKNVFEEMSDCFENHGIRSFCFQDPLFTSDSERIFELCNLINSSNLQNEVRLFVACDIKTFNGATAMKLKETGCRSVIFPFISGSDFILKKNGFDYTSEDCRNAAEIAQKAKLKIFGIYITGFADEDENTMTETRKLIIDVNAERFYTAILLPYPCAKSEKIALEESIIKEPLLKETGVKIPPPRTKFLTTRELLKFRRHTKILTYVNPGYILKRTGEAVKSPYVAVSCLRKIYYKIIGK